MIFSLSDSIGYLALVLNLYSMSCKSEQRLRWLSVAANSIYIVYGLLITALPIIVGCSVAVFLHLYRLYTLKPKTYETTTTR